MHLADITMFYGPHSGGVRRYLQAKHDWFAGRPGWRHTLVLPAPAAAGEGDGAVVRVPAPPLPFSDGYRFPLRGGPWIDALRALQPDLIEVGDPYRLAWAAQQAGRALHVPVAAFYHSDLLALAQVRGWLPARLVARYVRRLYRGFDIVFAPSAVAAARLRAVGVTQVVHQPLGVDCRRFRPLPHADRALRRRLGLGDGVRLLAFVGRAGAEKHIDALLAMMSRLGGNYHLLLAGPGMPGGGRRHVSVWPTFQTPAEVAAIMAGADAFVHAGDCESFGLVLLEALACGCPVVGVAAGAVPELVTAEVGELAPRAEPTVLAAAVQRLFADPAATAQRRHAARQYALACWSWERGFTQLEGHYRQLVRRAA
ncbi:MAG TPA: glycosyltransferase [Gammaproteobacteria bacterium]|nr:glycosyltransferase [Gammaproteobacteria bacterium]